MPTDAERAAEARKNALRRRAKAWEYAPFSKQGMALMTGVEEREQQMREAARKAQEFEQELGFRQESLGEQRSLREQTLSQQKELAEAARRQERELALLRLQQEREEKAASREIQKRLLDLGYIPGVGFVPGMAQPPPAGPPAMAPSHAPAPGAGQPKPAAAAPRNPMEGVMRKQLPADVRKNIDDLDDIMLTLDNASAVVKARPQAFGFGKAVGDFLPGPVGGRLAGALQAKTRDPADTEARTAVYEHAQNVIHKLAGTAQSAAELQSIRQFAPDPNEDATQILAKLEGAKRIAMQRRTQAYSTYLPGIEPPAAQPFAHPGAPEGARIEREGPPGGGQPSIDDLVKKYTGK